MKEAYGGIFNLVFLAIFLTIAIGSLGLVFAYTKAFKMKNEIIAVIEEYEGSGCYSSNHDTSCFRKIKDRARDLAYNPVSLNCPLGYENYEDLYCWKKVERTLDDGRHVAIFTVITQVEVPFPVIANITGFRFFQVGGDTKQIQLQLNK